MDTLSESNEPAELHPGVSNGRTILMHELLFRMAGRRSEHPAISHNGQTISYSELAEQASKLASALIASGIGRQERVAIFLEKRIETVIAIFGIAAAGAVFVPINPALKPRQVAYIMANCDVKALITSKMRFSDLSETLGECPDLSFVTLVDGGTTGEPSPINVQSWQSLLARGEDRTLAPYPVTDSDMVAILYTSGSTGNPKGVVLMHRNVVAGAASVATYLRYNDADRILNLPPYSFDFGLNQLLSSVYAGTTAILHNYVSLDSLMRTLVDERVTGLSAVPTVMIQIAQARWPQQAVDGLRYLSTTGGRMPETAVRALRAKLPKSDLYLMYGLTESFRSTFLPPKEVDRRPNSIGKAIPNAEVLVARPDGTICDAYEHGELVHRGILVSLGYWNDPEKTAERFRPAPGVPKDHPNPELAVWSGDTVYRDEEGFIFYVGRKDEMIKTSGYRVSPTEIEEVIYRSGLVDTAAAVGVDHPELGQSIIVFATSKDGGPLRTDDLFAFARDNLPTYMVPQQILSRETLPLNSNGKVDRKALAAEYRESAGASAPAPVAKSIAQAPKGLLSRFSTEAIALLGIRRKKFSSVDEIFRWTFNRGQIDPRHSFAELGGDSLSYVSCSVVLEEYLGRLPPNWEHTPVGELERLTRTEGKMVALRPDILLRAIAILAVVAGHNGYTSLNGAPGLLFIVSGLSFFRFSWDSDPRQVWASVFGMISKLLIPMLAFMSIFFIADRQIVWSMVFFVQNIVGHGQLSWWMGAWFVQALFQIFIFMALLASIPGVSNFGAKRPFSFSLMLVAGALALNYAIALIGGPVLQVASELPQYYLWQFALGGLILASNTLSARIISLATALASIGVLVLMKGMTGDPTLTEGPAKWIIGGTALLLWLPPIAVPRALAAPILIVARASLFIYLFHWRIEQIGISLWHIHGGILGSAVGLAGAILIWAVYEAALKALGPMLRQPRGSIVSSEA